MQRREFIATIGAVTVVKPAQQEWIRIADSRKNVNGRIYTPELLEAIARAAKERHSWVVIPDPDIVSIPLDNILGVVSDARVDQGYLEIQVKWFSGKRPIGAFITPCGMTNKQPDPQIQKYRFQYFEAYMHSAFDCATAVSA